MDSNQTPKVNTGSGGHRFGTVDGPRLDVVAPSDSRIGGSRVRGATRAERDREAVSSEGTRLLLRGAPVATRGSTDRESMGRLLTRGLADREACRSAQTPGLVTTVSQHVTRCL